MHDLDEARVDEAGVERARWPDVAPALAPTGVAVLRSYEERFADLVTLHHGRLAHLAYLLCGDRAQAEDAVAEAYARVWPRYRKGHVTEAVPYLRRAVVNQVHGSFRRRVLERREQERCTLDIRVDLDVAAAIHDREVLRPALLALPPTQRAVIVLRFLEDVSEEETASILGVKPGTVKSRTARALEQLRRLVGESHDG